MKLQAFFPVIILLATAHGLKMPTLENIGDIFKNLVQTKQEDIKDTPAEEAKERVKRQDPGIGDESNLPYEAISSR